MHRCAQRARTNLGNILSGWKWPRKGGTNNDVPFDWRSARRALAASSAFALANTSETAASRVATNGALQCYQGVYHGHVHVGPGVHNREMLHETLRRS